MADRTETLPGAELVETGLADLLAGRDTTSAAAAGRERAGSGPLPGFAAVGCG